MNLFVRDHGGHGAAVIAVCLFVAAASRPPSTAAAPAASRQPLRAHQIPRHTSTTSSKARPVSHIGVPTNVTHTGHAKTEQEAKELIERLLAASSPGAAAAAQLPAPLLPQPSPPTHSPAGGQYTCSDAKQASERSAVVHVHVHVHVHV